MEGKFSFPKVTSVSVAISSHYHCDEAVLVKVEEGTGSLAFESNDQGMRVLLNGQCLFSINDEQYCPTCGGTLWRGYGERDLSMAEAMRLGGRINESYSGIAEAVSRISPLLGLLTSGYYFVADYRLFPIIGREHFWNSCKIPGDYEPPINTKFHDDCCPSYMLPSQQASRCNPEQVEHYIHRLDEADRYPRAIGCYLGGNSVMLLDGHHKAAAAASRGQMVKCLVIMPVSLSPRYAAETEGTLLYDGNVLRSDQGEIMAWLRAFRGVYSEEGQVAVADVDHWGTVPERYKLNVSAYRHIPHEDFSEWIYRGREGDVLVAREKFQRYFPQTLSKADTIRMLRWHQLQFNALSRGTQTPWQMGLLNKQQWKVLNRAAEKYGIDRNPKTANLVYGVFSFLPGQREIRADSGHMEEKLKMEIIHTVLIPNSVRKVDKQVFDQFPDLENIVLEKGNPWLRQRDFTKLAENIRRRREQERIDAMHLRQYPFADLARMLKEKQEQK